MVGKCVTQPESRLQWPNLTFGILLLSLQGVPNNVGQAGTRLLGIARRLKIGRVVAVDLLSYNP